MRIKHIMQIAKIPASCRSFNERAALDARFAALLRPSRRLHVVQRSTPDIVEDPMFMFDFEPFVFDTYVSPTAVICLPITRVKS